MIYRIGRLNNCFFTQTKTSPTINGAALTMSRRNLLEIIYHDFLISNMTGEWSTEIL